jgi:cysteine synthase A
VVAHLRPISASTLDAIGNTPLVPLGKLVPPDSAEVLVKLEYYNPTGSYKDRMALAMIAGAEARGALRPGMRVVEYSGGSTGSSLAFVCAVKGYPCTIVSSDAFAQEKLQTMRVFGAELITIPSGDGKIRPALLQQMIARATELAAAPDAYRTDQFNNRDSLDGYQQIGDELLAQAGKRIDAFCAGVGTAGMLMGAARALRRADPSTRVVALEPATAAIISTGQGGAHHIEGLGVGFVPPLLDPALYDEARGIDEGEAREMARQLARQEGIFAGTSTGLNVSGALQLARQLGPGHTVATVACDSGLKYLAGDLYEF